MNKHLPVIAVVVPCYNEEQALPLSVPKMLDVIDRMAAEGIASPESYLLLCNDGSRDGTWDVIQRLHLGNKRVKGISLAHNRGHQYVLLAGLMT
ncbi:MAG: glycosyltransferase, partial [Muribaculaceae bacterium]|nr:glycosyltransferase [Muribaculaceae bacterium]